MLILGLDYSCWISLYFLTPSPHPPTLHYQRCLQFVKQYAQWHVKLLHIILVHHNDAWAFCFVKKKKKIYRSLSCSLVFLPAVLMVGRAGPGIQGPFGGRTGSSSGVLPCLPPAKSRANQEGSKPQPQPRASGTSLGTGMGPDKLHDSYFLALEFTCL